jgi:hypothetical protein
MRRGFGLVGLLGVLLIAGISGVIGYNIGLSAGIINAGETTALVVAPWGLGFGPFGFLFGILFFFLIVGLIGRLLFGGRRHGHGFGAGGPGSPSGPGWGGGWGSSGPRGWDWRTMPPFVEPMLRDWHSQAHGGPSVATESPAAGGASGPTTPGSGPAAPPAAV